VERGPVLRNRIVLQSWPKPVIPEPALWAHGERPGAGSGRASGGVGEGLVGVGQE